MQHKGLTIGRTVSSRDKHKIITNNKAKTTGLFWEENHLFTIVPLNLLVFRYSLWLAVILLILQYLYRNILFLKRRKNEHSKASYMGLSDHVTSAEHNYFVVVIYLFVNFKFVERWSITMRNKSVKNVKQNGRSVWPTTVCLSKGEKNPKSYSGDNLVKKRGTKRGPETYLCTIESTEHQLSTAGSASSLMMSRSLPAFSCFSLHGS